jgi:hypothetical protein
MKRRFFKTLRLVLLLVLVSLAIGVLVLRHRSPTLSDRFYRARGGRFVQLDSRDYRMRLIFIHEYPNDEALSWKVDELTSYLPGRAPVIIAPVPLLRLTPTNEETAGPLSAAKGNADKKPNAGWGFSFNMGTNKPPNNQYPSLTLRPPPATKPAEKPPTMATLDSFNISKPIPTPAGEQPQFVESSIGTLTVINSSGSYLSSSSTATFTTAGSGQTNVLAVKSGSNSTQILTSTSITRPALPPAWPYRSYSLPHWLVALMVGFYPLLVSISSTRRRFLRWRRGRSILCLSCGYDIRATPDRCPECGTVNGAPTVPATA